MKNNQTQQTFIEIHQQTLDRPSEQAETANPTNITQPANDTIPCDSVPLPS
jgi:hypothetical protein